MANFGVIMDLDGTLVDSPLDFDHIRADLGLSPGAPILEAIEAGPVALRSAKHARLREHEWAAARASSLFPGVREFWARMERSGLRRAIFTRNTREVAEFCLAHHRLPVDLLVAREDAAPKPDPAGLHWIRGQWGLPAERLIYLGDYRFDLEAGRRAGIRTWLFAPGEPPPFAHEADFVYRSYGEAIRQLDSWAVSP